MVTPSVTASGVINLSDVTGARQSGYVHDDLHLRRILYDHV